jgi:hypothetical protein
MLSMLEKPMENAVPQAGARKFEENLAMEHKRGAQDCVEYVLICPYLGGA